MDFYEVWYDCYAIWDKIKIVLINFLQLVYQCDLLEIMHWEDDNLWWHDYISCCSILLIMWTIHAAVFVIVTVNYCCCKLLVVIWTVCSIPSVCLWCPSAIHVTVYRWICELSVLLSVIVWTVHAVICQWLGHQSLCSPLRMETVYFSEMLCFHVTSEDSPIYWLKWNIEHTY